MHILRTAAYDVTARCLLPAWSPRPRREHPKRDVTPTLSQYLASREAAA
jgi:hypothetical protein